jgi:hypothetical protein
MTDAFDTQRSGLRRSAGRSVFRLIAAAAVTAAIGAVANGIYERLFDPQAYAAGTAIGRAAFAFLYPFPFILAGLLVVGTPVTYVLSRWHIDNVMAYAIAGATGGGLIGMAMAEGFPRVQWMFVGYGCVSAVAYWALRYRDG